MLPSTMAVHTLKSTSCIASSVPRAYASTTTSPLCRLHSPNSMRGSRSTGAPSRVSCGCSRRTICHILPSSGPTQLVHSHACIAPDNPFPWIISSLTPKQTSQRSLMEAVQHLQKRMHCCPHVLQSACRGGRLCNTVLGRD